MTVGLKDGDKYRVGLTDGETAALALGVVVVLICAAPPAHCEGIAHASQVPREPEQKSAPAVDDAKPGEHWQRTGCALAPVQEYPGGHRRQLLAVSVQLAQPCPCGAAVLGA